jgi:hypothetical protein
MAMFDVYVEGATEPTPQATQRLAEVMSQRYGLGAADLVARLSKGRFRVKANIDEDTANTYARDLEAVGARVTVTEARGTSTLPPPRPGVSQPPSSRGLPSQPPRPAPSSLPPASRPPPSSALPPRPIASVPPSNAPYASGLSAAFHENTPVPELGALDKDAFSVESLDGHADVELERSPMPDLPASIGPAAKSATKSKPPKDVPIDMFAPPDAQDGELEMKLAADDTAHHDRRKLATPATTVPAIAAVAPASSPMLRPKSTSLPPQGATGGVRMASIAGEDQAPRWRFAAGVLASVVLGFIPANCVHGMREGSAFEKIDTEVATVQTQAASNTGSIPFAQLDTFRDEQRSRKKSERRNIAIVSMLIWALAGAGIGYVWFRRVPWDKIKFGG